MTEVGRVVAVSYAAVKGTRHVARDALELDEHGVVGDRRWCLVDPAAGRVLRTVSHPALARLVVDPPPDASRGAVPTGERVVADYWGREVDLEVVGGPLADRAAALLGLPAGSLRLAAAPPGAVVYGGGVSLVSTASAAAVGADPVGRLRTNVVVEVGGGPFAEDAWVGRRVALGEAVVAPSTRTPRCAVVDRDPTTGEVLSPRVLEALAARPERRTPSGPVLGVDGAVVRSGRVRVGDAVELLGEG